MGRRGYSSEFRRDVLGQIKIGRKVADVAQEFGISAQTIYSWRRQEQVSKRLALSLADEARAELLAAKHRIAQLEAELEAQRQVAGAHLGAMRPKESVRTAWKPLEVDFAGRREMRSPEETAC